MFAPPLYTVRSFNIKYIIEHNYNIQLSYQEERRFFIKQQDNQLFRLTRKITHNKSPYNWNIIFIDCSGCSNIEDAVDHLMRKGLVLNNKHFVCSERSASMTRNGILGMIDADMADEINERITMGITFDKTVLSKYYAYRGLMFSSCHCLEGYRPKVIVVPDHKTILPDQRIKYIYDKEQTITNEDGSSFVWKQKDIAEGVRGVKTNTFDGCGLHSPAISRQVESLLGSKTPMTSIQWRFPYIKGLTHEVNYTDWFLEHGVEYIQDRWGKWHDVHDDMIILTESMYKGLDYFKRSGDANDWDRYWDAFEKYDHCLGVAKWNFSFDEEPIYTRANYQILQDLDLDYDSFAELAEYSVDWAERIIDGDPIYTYCFLGLTLDKCKPRNAYTKAVLKNPAMLHEPSVRNFVISSISKYLDDMKCGKLWFKSSFRFLIPDLIMMMEHIAGMELRGCLEADEFFTVDRDGVVVGERIIDRNPHICHSEHVILRAVDNPEAVRWLGHLSNACVLNSKSIVAQKLNGAD